MKDLVKALKKLAYVPLATASLIILNMVFAYLIGPNGFASAGLLFDLLIEFFIHGSKILILTLCFWLALFCFLIATGPQRILEGTVSGFGRAIADYTGLIVGVAVVLIIFATAAPYFDILDRKSGYTLALVLVGFLFMITPFLTFPNLEIVKSGAERKIVRPRFLKQVNEKYPKRVTGLFTILGVIFLFAPGYYSAQHDEVHVTTKLSQEVYEKVLEAADGQELDDFLQHLIQRELQVK